MRGDHDDYDPARAHYAEHDTRDDGAGVVVWVVIAFFFAAGFCAGWVFTKLPW